MSATGADMQASLSTGEPIHVDTSLTRELGGSEEQRYNLDAGASVLIEVENLGRGTILSVYDAHSELIQRAANWRGSEGKYTSLIESGSPVTLVVSPDKAIAPPGNYSIAVRRIDPSDPAYIAERSMSLGADKLLAHYFGNSDSRADALTHFHTAIDEFRSLENVQRYADATFEAAGVYFIMGEHEEAETYYSRALAAWTELEDPRGISAAEVALGLIRWRTDRPLGAIRIFERVAARRNELGDRFFFAQAINNIGLVHRNQGNIRSAREHFREALEAWQGSVDLLDIEPAGFDFDAVEQPPWLIDSLEAINNLAWTTELLSDPAATENLLMQGLALSEYLSRGEMAAKLQGNLGRLKYRTGDLQSALDYLGQALDYFTAVKQDEIWAAHAYRARALVHRAAGDAVRARLDLLDALRLRTIERDPLGRAETLLSLGELAVDDRRCREALGYVSDVLSISNSGSSYIRVRAAAFDLAGRAYRDLLQYRDAEVSHDKAISLYIEAGDLRGEATARLHRAVSLLQSGLDGDASEDLDLALQLAEHIQDRLLQIGVRTAQARLHLAAGNVSEALRIADMSLAAGELLRSEIVDPVLLRYFASNQRNDYDIAVNAAIESGEIEKAWLAADNARAQRFSEMLKPARQPSDKLDSATSDRLLSLIHMRANRLAERTELLSENAEPATPAKVASVATIDAELSEIVAEIERINLRANQAAADDPPVTLAKLQSVLRHDEVLLEYYLGDLGGGVWSITHDSVNFRRLPNREMMVERILPLINGIQKRSARPPKGMQAVSEMLLGAELGDLGADKRLVIIPDGVLNYLPFSVLLNPQSGYQDNLLGTFAISYSPSSESLVKLADYPSNSSSGIAIVADPVFDAQDPRVRVRATGNAVVEPLLLHAAERAGIGSLRRLPGTAAESSAIAKAASNINVFKAHGTAASRNMVLSGTLDDYKIIHFATHGILDDEEPALSGLVLSAVSPYGEPQLQFLRSQDIVRLRLRADLVVLSGCDTGSGRVVRGEGLFGLSRAFFHAGARQVVSSLWQVPDRTTAKLMEHFYNEILQNGRDPTEALRLAKMKIASDPRWRSPYFWAPFIVQGARLDETLGAIPPQT